MRLRRRVGAAVVGAAVLVAAGLTVGALSSGSGSSLTPSPSDTVSASTLPVRVGHLTTVHDPGHVTGHVSGSCHTRDAGQLPDPRCTPGSYDPSVTAAQLCAPGYTTRTYRPPSSETTHAKWIDIVPAYGLPASFHGELDHLVSLELGGSNDESNLWPEAGSIPNPKDAVENRLHDEVCAGTISLRAAQREIASDWETAK